MSITAAQLQGPGGVDRQHVYPGVIIPIYPGENAGVSAQIGENHLSPGDSTAAVSEVRPQLSGIPQIPKLLTSVRPQEAHAVQVAPTQPGSNSGSAVGKLVRHLGKDRQRVHRSGMLAPLTLCDLGF